MEKFKEFTNQYFWLIFIAFAALMIVVIVSIYPLFNSVDKTITNQPNESKKAVQEANNANRGVANFDIERRTEDVIREKTIAPKLEKLRRNSQNSKTEVEKARKTYNEKKNDTSNLSNSDADNCSKLKNLFPNIRFQDCQ